ncbi:MAG TPA: hypothetical protein VFU22_28145 [Roseiflexaceae bacterium]|nr:hypothetical protein [Roseiflexaceae bacterium]
MTSRPLAPAAPGYAAEPQDLLEPARLAPCGELHLDEHYPTADPN